MLVLRPEPGASATVDRARQLGLEALAAPLFEIEPVDWDAPEAGSFDGLLLTSANAVRQGGDKLRDLRGLKTYAVGTATAATAREAGFDVAALGNAGVSRLLASIEPDLRLLHLCGECRRSPEASRQSITAIIVYRSKTIDRPKLPALVGVIALIHSPRAGRRFGELVRARDQVSIAAISADAAAAVGDGWAAVETASEPSDDALLALAASLCNKPHPK